jgi:hypothetical protein
MQKIQAASYDITAIQDEVLQLREEQKKLTDLIPLSAAASGMIAGEKQLHNLKDAIVTGIVEAMKEGSISLSAAHAESQSMERETARRSGSASTLNRQYYYWGGKHRAIPETFRMHRDGLQIREAWRLWWCGTTMTTSRIPPYRLIANEFAVDIVDICRHIGERSEPYIRAFSELNRVMKFVEQFGENIACDTIHDLRRTLRFSDPTEAEATLLWMLVWPEVEKEFQQNCRRG